MCGSLEEGPGLRGIVAQCDPHPRQIRETRRLCPWIRVDGLRGIQGRGATTGRRSQGARESECSAYSARTDTRKFHGFGFGRHQRRQGKASTSFHFFLRKTFK
jgi:hypothetical protein